MVVRLSVRLSVDHKSEFHQNGYKRRIVTDGDVWKKISGPDGRHGPWLPWVQMVVIVAESLGRHLQIAMRLTFCRFPCRHGVESNVRSIGTFGKLNGTQCLHFCLDPLFFIALQHRPDYTAIRHLRLSVRPSVCHALVLYWNDWTDRHAINALW